MIATQQSTTATAFRTSSIVREGVALMLISLRDPLYTPEIGNSIDPTV